LVSDENTTRNPGDFEQYLAEEGLSGDIEDEFLLHHVLPDWIKAPEAITPGQHSYIAEFLYEGIIKIQMQFDRATLVNLFKSILTIVAYMKALANKNIYPIHLEDAQSLLVRGNGFDRFISDSIIVWDKGTDQEYRESIESASARIRADLQGYPTWAECFESIDKEAAAYVESGFATSIALRMANTITRHFQDLGAFKWSSDGTVSREIYNRLAFDKMISVRPRGAGGNTRSKHNWTEDEKIELESHYLAHLSRIQAAKRWFNKNRKDNDWPKLIRVKYPDFSDSLIRRLCHRHNDPYRWNPADIAIEYAARLCNLHGFTYRPFSYTPRQLREKLPKSKTPHTVRENHSESDLP
jgi:hypothetical protein